MRAVAILERARTRRFAMVASGTRKARAMAGTSSRASVRSERATWASRPSAGVAAGEDQAQHVVAQGGLWLHRLDRLLDLVRRGLGSPPERGGLLGRLG